MSEFLIGVLKINYGLGLRIIGTLEVELLSSKSKLLWFSIAFIRWGGFMTLSVGMSSTSILVLLWVGYDLIYSITFCTLVSVGSTGELMKQILAFEDSDVSVLI